MKTHMKEALVI